MESPNPSLFNSSSSSSKPEKMEKIPFDSSLLDTKTPEKPFSIPLRSRNRRAIMSLKELKQAANSLRKPDPVISTRPDPVKKKISRSKASTGKRKVDSSVKLPEKYEILDDFFNGLDSSIRLLQLKGSVTTFGNIIPKVECLTDRRFTYKNLAQMKFLLPEAFQIRKVLVRDERTSCMKPDLHIGLNVKPFEEEDKGKSVNANGILRKVFRARLVDFSNAHPEGDEVPAESLPKPFDEQREQMPDNRQVSKQRLNSTDSVPPATQKPFDEQREQMPDNRQVSKQRLNSTDSVPPATQTVKPTIKLASSASKTCSSAAASPQKYSTLLPSYPLYKTPTKNIKLEKSEASAQGTPAHLVSTPLKLMTATPSLRPPKRSEVTPESFQSPVKLARRPPRVRTLNFEDGHSTIDAETLDVLPQDLIESIREKERKDLMENDPAISQAKWRQKMISKLPKFFDMLYFLLQSIKRSVFTKEELVHKILSNNLDMIDKREVEDHLAILQEFVPEWIYEKSASSGDLLFCINKIQNPQSIRSRIAEAK